MGNLDALFHGFTVALTFKHVLLMLIGVLLGILVGVLPGLGAPNGVTILMPLTYNMDPVSAIILLTSMYWGALFGGSNRTISLQPVSVQTQTGFTAAAGISSMTLEPANVGYRGPRKRHRHRR